MLSTAVEKLEYLQFMIIIRQEKADQIYMNKPYHSDRKQHQRGRGCHSDRKQHQRGRGLHSDRKQHRRGRDCQQDMTNHRKVMWFLCWSQLMIWMVIGEHTGFERFVGMFYRMEIQASLMGSLIFCITAFMNRPTGRLVAMTDACFPLI